MSEACKEEEFDFSALGPSREDYEQAREWANEGVSFITIRERLVQRRMRDEFVEQIVVDVAAEYVKPLAIAGVSAVRIEERLVGMGLNDRESRAVCGKVGTDHRGNLRRRELPTGKFLAAAVAMFVVGAVARYAGQFLGNIDLSLVGSAAMFGGFMLGGFPFAVGHFWPYKPVKQQPGNRSR